MSIRTRKPGVLIWKWLRVFTEKEKENLKARPCERAGQGMREAGMFERRAEGHSEHRKVCVSPLNKAFTSTLDINSNLIQVGTFSPFLCLFLFEKKPTKHINLVNSKNGSLRKEVPF